MMTSKRMLMFVAVVLGCNFYGPGNPPPDDGDYGPDRMPPYPKYAVKRVDAAASDGIATATCPVGSIVISGGGDCVVCTPVDPAAYLFGSNFNGTAQAWTSACYPGCAHAVAYCLSSTDPGTLSQMLGIGGGEPKDAEAAFRAARAARP